MNQFNTKFKAVIFDFEGTIVHGNKVYDDVKALIIKLKKSGIALGIASNTSTSSIRERLEKHNLLEYFDTIVGIDQVDYMGKPAPDLFLRVAEDLNSEPSTCLVIEDSLSGVEGARGAGMDVVLVRGEKNIHAILECFDLEDAKLDKILF